MQAIWVTLRVLLSIGGGYAVSAAASAALALGLFRFAGFERAEATALGGMLGFGFYLFALLWAFTTPRLSRVATVLVGGSLLFYGFARWLSPASVVTLSSLIAPLSGG